MGRNIIVRDLDFLVAEDVEREIGNHLLGNPLPRLDRIFAPDRRAGRENFDEGESGLIALQFERFAHRATRLHDVLVVGECDALDVNRRFKRRKHLGHVQRETFVDGTASPWRSGATLSDQRGRSHLAAGHPVDRIVHEKHADFFAAVGSMHDFGGADGGEVSVSLVSDDDLAGAGALQSGRGCGSAAVCDLHVPDVKVVISEDRAADGTHENRLVLEFEIFDGFGDQFVSHAVAASGAIVCLVTEVGFSFVLGIKNAGLGVDDVVSVGRYFRFFQSYDFLRHNPRSLQRLKPRKTSYLCGTTEVVPFPLLSTLLLPPALRSLPATLRRSERCRRRVHKNRLGACPPG